MLNPLSKCPAALRRLRTTGQVVLTVRIAPLPPVRNNPLIIAPYLKRRFCPGGRQLFPGFGVSLAWVSKPEGAPHPPELGVLPKQEKKSWRRIGFPQNRNFLPALPPLKRPNSFWFASAARTIPPPSCIPTPSDRLFSLVRKVLTTKSESLFACIARHESGKFVQHSSAYPPNRQTRLDAWKEEVVQAVASLSIRSSLPKLPKFPLAHAAPCRSHAVQYSPQIAVATVAGHSYPHQ
jgi:hypothetical protein